MRIKIHFFNRKKNKKISHKLLYECSRKTPLPVNKKYFFRLKFELSFFFIVKPTRGHISGASCRRASYQGEFDRIPLNGIIVANDCVIRDY